MTGTSRSGTSYPAGFEDGRREPGAKECKSFLEVGKGFPRHLNSGPERLLLDF